MTTGVGETGVAGLLRNGDGPTVMLRADMDALPVPGASGVDYASTVTATGSALALRSQLSAFHPTEPNQTCMPRSAWQYRPSRRD